MILAGIFAALKSRWLYVVTPKLYLNTPISNGGQIISLEILNAGFLPEEDVAITLRPSCNFELIATSKSTLSVNGKTLSIPKLSRSESITVLLLVEGKAFENLDIESIESKACKGKIVDKKDKATSLLQNILVIPLILLFLGPPFCFGTVVGADTGLSALTYLEQKLELFGDSKQLAGFKTNLIQRYSILEDDDYVKNSKLIISVKEIVRRNDVLTITLKVTNKSDEVITIDGQSDSTAGEKKLLSYSDTRIESFGLMPSQTKEIKFKAYLPEDIEVKVVATNLTLSTISGKNLIFSHTITFDN